MHMLFSIVLAAMAAAPQPAPDLSLRLVSIRTGMGDEVESYAKGRLRRSTLTPVAESVGFDLFQRESPLVAHKLSDGRLFYAFYKTMDGCFGDRPYVIQRVKRTIRGYADADDKEPVEEVDYLVEVFKTHCGSLKRGPDRHFGRFALQSFAKREIIKEFEIGYGEIPGACTGKDWPFNIQTLYALLQDYKPDASTYDKVQFTRSIKWTLRVELGAADHYRVACDELGFDLPGRPPADDATTVAEDALSRDIVLSVGEGFDSVRVCRSRPAAVAKRLGPVWQVVKTVAPKANHHYPGGLSFSFKSGVLNTIMTRPDFAGRTSKGIRLGDKRSRVRRAYGKPDKGSRYALDWTYNEGIRFYFSGEDRVSKIVIGKGRKKKR